MNQTSGADALRDHLARWGLRHFTSDEQYFAWQRQRLTQRQLGELARCAERKRSGGVEEEVAFYDLSADPAIFPILYSQRYEYYEAVGARIAARIRSAGTVLDLGCGPGILTTFYADQSPNVRFVGLDRSPASIALARQRAAEMGLTNLDFICADLTAVPVAETFDLVIATHTIVQAESDPGLPSRDWTTFARTRDSSPQQAFERRTGVGARLDALTTTLSNGGRLLLFEKSRQLARRVPLQRALAGRNFSLEEAPESVRYRTIEEVSDDGPLFVLRKHGEGLVPWDESPEPDEGLPFTPSDTVAAPRASGDPIYENHWASAQRVWEGLEGRSVLKEHTCGEPDGRQMHVELGTAGAFAYLYCANTFDQRQLVIAQSSRRAILDSYFQDIVKDAGRSR